MENKHDMIIVGTGWHGLVAAKVYIELHPQEDIVVLEAEGSCGGTWSAERLYPGLKSNNLWDTYEYPDYPMSYETYGVKPGQHIPGAVLHQYLTDFAKKFGVFERTQFNTSVESLQMLPDKTWKLQVVSPEGRKTLSTKKVILATGLTSTPNFPQYKGAENFKPPYFHAKDFCRKGEVVKTSENAVIVGSAKSALDAAYAFAVEGVHVDLVMRETGNGPVWISYPWVMGGKKRLEKLLTVRWMTWFSPCPFGGIDGWQKARNFLHGTAVGRFIVEKFWAGLGDEILEVNGYAKHDEVAKLKPWNSPFWIGSGLSIHNYDQDLYKLIRDGKISIHQADVDHLSGETVHLTNGTDIRTDVLICATGWKKEPSVQFLDFGEAGLGFSTSKQEVAAMATEADEKILSMYPKLRNQPPLKFKPKNDPYRLYRYIIPPATIPNRNIAFAGLVSSTFTASAANAQALWISAFLDGKLDKPVPNEHDVVEETILHTQWGKWRYPCGYGATIPDMVFDTLPYMDLLLSDLGLQINRKPTMWTDLTEPYSPRDYIGLVDEWLEHRGPARSSLKTD